MAETFIPKGQDAKAQHRSHCGSAATDGRLAPGAAKAEDAPRDGAGEILVLGVGMQQMERIPVLPSR